MGKSMREMTEELTQEDRLQIADRWLKAAGLPNTETDQEALAPQVFACRAGSAVEQVASQFLREGRVLDPKAVVDVVRKERAAADAELIETEAPKLVAFLNDYRQGHDAGPRWAAVAEHMGWTSRECDYKLRRLRVNGVVSFTTTPGSLAACP